MTVLPPRVISKHPSIVRGSTVDGVHAPAVVGGLHAAWRGRRSTSDIVPPWTARDLKVLAYPHYGRGIVPPTALQGAFIGPDLEDDPSPPGRGRRLISWAAAIMFLLVAACWGVYGQR